MSSLGLYLTDIDQGWRIFRVCLGCTSLWLSVCVLSDRSFLAPSSMASVLFMALASLGIIFGVLTPVSAVAFGFCFRVVRNQCPTAFDAGELMLNYFLLLLMAGELVPSFRPDAPGFSAAYLSLLYLFTGLGKLRDPSWRNGTILSEFLHDRMLTRLPFPTVLPTVCVSRALIAMQLAFPLFVWVPFLRIPVLFLMLATHAVMEFYLNVLVFPQVVVCGILLCFYMP